MRYIDSRGDNFAKFDFEHVLLGGLTSNAGLYVPEEFPVLSSTELASLKELDYQALAVRILSMFTGDTFTKEELQGIISKAYSKFDCQDIAPLTKLKHGLYMLNLYHGPTLAFKDYAMQVLSGMFEVVLKRSNKRSTIIAATSGDTGSAAIEAFKDNSTMNVLVLYPNGHVSEVQRRQMTTVISQNVRNIALEGSFDDCQNIVKDIFSDTEFKSAHNLSAVNSINWARIAIQIVYYFYAGLQLDADEKKVSFCVPTGNFGNIFAAYAAKQMGLKIENLIIATNTNNILKRFIDSGIMQKEKVLPSLSPSMDIQISSNFERLLFFSYGRDTASLKKLMHDFKTIGKYSVNADALKYIKETFLAFEADNAVTLQTIKNAYQEFNVLIDPHTAVGLHAAFQYKSNIPLVTLSTAHPSKFADTAHKATGVMPKLPSFLADLFERKEAYTVLPNSTDAVKAFIVNEGF